jgi:hypothetical protein
MKIICKTTHNNHRQGRRADPATVILGLTSHSENTVKAVSVSIGKTIAKSMGLIDRDRASAALAEEDGVLYFCVYRNNGGSVVDGKRGERLRVRFGAACFPSGFSTLAAVIGDGIELRSPVQFDGMTCFALPSGGGR